MSHIVIYRLWQLCQTTNTFSRKTEQGHLRATTPLKDRYVTLNARRNNANNFFQEVVVVSGTMIWRQTVYKRLAERGFSAWRPVADLLLRCFTDSPSILES